MMRKEILKEPSSTERIPAIIRQSPSVEAMQEQLKDYHDHDIAQSFEHLSRGRAESPVHRTGRPIPGGYHLLHEQSVGLHRRDCHR